jgi:hypothetical protein
VSSTNAWGFLRSTRIAGEVPEERPSSIHVPVTAHSHSDLLFGNRDPLLDLFPIQFIPDKSFFHFTNSNSDQGIIVPAFVPRF